MPKPLRLVLLSALMLFVELALIRWTGSNIIYLSYFSNFVLLGSFLDIAIGLLRGKVRANLFPYAPIALITGYQALVVLVGALYGAAFLAGRAYLRRGAEAAEPSPAIA